MTNLTPHFWVQDMRRSIDFYRDALGFEVRRAEPEGAPAFASLARGDDGLMLSPHGAFTEVWPLERQAEARRGSQAPMSMFLESSDLHADFVRARSAGARIVDEPGERPWGQREFVVADPDGYWWTVYQAIGGASA
jgi:lactoylglutathione lyase